jgi:hypothetical protein
MIGNRYGGDSLAEAFQSILKKNQEMKKQAQALFDSSAEDDPADAVLNHKPEGDLLPDPESFLMSLDKPESDDISGALDGSIESFESRSEACGSCGEMECACAEKPFAGEYFDATAAHILQGLGKIAGSLQSKGHVFASDIVGATAMSIKDDFIKEAANKARVTSELQKMAKELSDSGNVIASDMVIVTIDKIKKG